MRGGARPVLGDVLVHGRQLDQARHVVVVDADQRQVVGHTDAAVARRPERSERHLVGEREHGGRWSGLVEQGVERLVAALDREVAGRVQRRVGREAGVVVGLLETLLALVRHDETEHVVGLAVDETDPTVAELDQVLRRQAPDLDVVDAEARHPRVVVADVDDLHALALQPRQFVVGERHVDADQAVDAPRDRPGDLEHVAILALGPHADDDRVVAGLGEHGLGPGHDVREVPAVEQRDGERHGA